MKMIMALIGLSIIFLSSGCGDSQKNDALQILGERALDDHGDTIYHSVPDFSFMNQDSQVVSSRTLADHIYIADFFFTSCPTICPRVKQQMIRIDEEFKDIEQLKLVSHTIDTKRDSIPRLKEYADKLRVNSQRWSFVTGKKEAIYDIADDYFSVAIEDPDAPGGFDHSGRLLLVDQNRHVRSFCNGTDPEDVDRFIKDIYKLLDESGIVSTRQ